MGRSTNLRSEYHRVELQGGVAQVARLRATCVAKPEEVLSRQLSLIFASCAVGTQVGEDANLCHPARWYAKRRTVGVPIQWVD